MISEDTIANINSRPTLNGRVQMVLEERNAGCVLCGLMACRTAPYRPKRGKLPLTNGSHTPEVVDRLTFFDTISWNTIGDA